MAVVGLMPEDEPEGSREGRGAEGAGETLFLSAASNLSYSVRNSAIACSRDLPRKCCQESNLLRRSLLSLEI